MGITQQRANYGVAWKITGMIIASIRDFYDQFLYAHPEWGFAWLMCLNKLVRMLFDPDNKDHLVDIIGYATLMLEDMNSERTDLPGQ